MDSVYEPDGRVTDALAFNKPSATGCGRLVLRGWRAVPQELKMEVLVNRGVFDDGIEYNDLPFTEMRGAQDIFDDDNAIYVLIYLK